MPKEVYKQKVRDVWLQSKEFKEWARKEQTEILSTNRDQMFPGLIPGEDSRIENGTDRNSIPESPPEDQVRPVDGSLLLRCSSHFACDLRRCRPGAVDGSEGLPYTREYRWGQLWKLRCRFVVAAGVDRTRAPKWFCGYGGGGGGCTITHTCTV
ncbi:hypothetical protein ACLKA6_010079 [Drosophila palustris]